MIDYNITGIHTTSFMASLLSPRPNVKQNKTGCLWKINAAELMYTYNSSPMKISTGAAGDKTLVP